VLRRLRDADGEILDHAMVLWLPGPRTVTGQDMTELHVHGGPAVIRAISKALIDAGARPAEAGEFSRRAFLAGRMDLLEAEGIADLIAAQTESQRRQALRQMDGAQSQLVQDWRQRLSGILAFQEAMIDFPDEDLPSHLETKVLADITALRDDVQEHIADSRQAVRLREGLVFAIVGAPNVGKSSLLNALSGREMAIVSPAPGTTRDPIEVPLELGGIPVTLVDTAGLRNSDDAVEREGIARAKARAASADLVIHVLDPWADMEVVGDRVLVVANKCDLGLQKPADRSVSARTGQGIRELRDLLAERARHLVATTSSPILNQARHVAALSDSSAALSAALEAPLPELRAEDLRLSMRALGRITGEVDVEAILDLVFGNFCIGK
jgi:tRNA modification GTPase